MPALAACLKEMVDGLPWMFAFISSRRKFRDANEILPIEYIILQFFDRSDIA